MRVRIKTVFGSLFDGLEGDLIHADVDHHGFFGLVDVDGFTDGRPLRFDLSSLEDLSSAEEIGGEP